MTSRSLTEAFVIMRNNATKNRNFYNDDRNSDAERLLKTTIREAEEGLELRDSDYGAPPPWLDKLEEAQYIMSKIKPKLDELGSLHARHLLQPAFDENPEEEMEIEKLSQEISKLITSTHRHIQHIRSSLEVGTKIERRLTANVVACLMLQLQELIFKFRNCQNIFANSISSREARSQQFFTENDDFTNIDLGASDAKENFVESFDNFLQPKPKPITTNRFLYDEQNEEQIDEHFQRPVSNKMTQQQLLLFEEENTRQALHREQEVTKIVRTIYDLNDIFKDLSQMVQEQGTVLDRIDYNVEQTQTRVTEGLKQLHRAEMYQRKNRKMCIIMILASITLFLLMLLIFTKF